MSGLSDKVECGGHAVVIPFNTTKGDLMGVFKELAAADWISNSTHNVIVDAMLFHLDSTMMAYLQVLFEVQAGGTVLLSPVVTPFAFSNSYSTGALQFVVYAFVLVSLMVALLRYLLIKGFGRSIDQLQLPGVVDIVFVVMLVVSVAVRLDWIRNSSSSAIDPVWQLDHPENFEHVATLFTRSITVDGFCAVFSVLLLVRFTRYISRCGPVVNTVLTSIPLGTALVVLAAALIAPWVPQPFLVIGSSVSNRFLNRMQHSCWGSLAPSTSDPSPRRTTTASRIKY